MPGSTFSDGSAAAAGDTTISTGGSKIPPKPVMWAVFPGRGYLIHSKPLISDRARSAGQSAGMSQTEKSFAENHAWFRMLSCLITRFSVDTFGDDPPIPLEHIWFKLASGYYRQMELGELGSEKRDAPDVSTYWVKESEKDLARIADPDDMGLNLIGSDGALIHPRHGIGIPIAAGGFDLSLFPAHDDEGIAGAYVGGSIEEFQKLHGRASLTYDWPT